MNICSRFYPNISFTKKLSTDVITLTEMITRIYYSFKFYTCPHYAATNVHNPFSRRGRSIKISVHPEESLNQFFELLNQFFELLNPGQRQHACHVFASPGDLFQHVRAFNSLTLMDRVCRRYVNLVEYSRSWAEFRIMMMELLRCFN